MGKSVFRLEAMFLQPKCARTRMVRACELKKDQPVSICVFRQVESCNPSAMMNGMGNGPDNRMISDSHLSICWNRIRRIRVGQAVRLSFRPYRIENSKAKSSKFIVRLSRHPTWKGTSRSTKVMIPVEPPSTELRNGMMALIEIF